MTYDFTGRIKEIQPIQTFASGFQKQIVIIDDEADRYPQEVPFTFLGKKTGLTALLRVGERVTVNFAVCAREWQGRYFVDLSALQVAREADCADSSAPNGAPGAQQAQVASQTPPPAKNAFLAPEVQEDPATWHNQQPGVSDELPF